MTGAGGNITTGAGTDEIDSAIAGGVGLTKNGAGTLVLGGANTYAGDTTINAGTLQIGSPTALSSSSNNLNVVAGTLDMHGYNLGVGGLSGAGVIDNLNSGATGAYR